MKILFPFFFILTSCVALVDDPKPIASIRTTEFTMNSDSTSALIKGEISYAGGPDADILERGFYWNRYGAPDSADNHLPAGKGIGQFSGQIDSLVPGETYFVRSYMILNEDGLKYGNERFLNVPKK